MFFCYIDSDEKESQARRFAAAPVTAPAPRITLGAMSATVDHLRANHPVRVIRDFTDARGLVRRAGDAGVIRMIDVDLIRMEIMIDWAPEGGAPERLHFPIAAADGPRNGKMRDYFEIGEEVFVPRPPRAEPPAPIRTVERPDIRLDDFAGRQPPARINLMEIAVACDCDPAFHRSLLRAGRIETHACLHCGAVTCTEMIGDEGRYTGDAWQAYWTIDMPQMVVDWLGRWPRVAINYAGAPDRWPMAFALMRYPARFYPADARCETLADLAALEARLDADQASRSRADILRGLCAGILPPPRDLPQTLSGFRELWETLRLTPETDVKELGRLAHPLNPASPIAVDILLQRPDARELVLSGLAHAEESVFAAAVAMARTARPIDPALGPAIIAIMDALPLDRLKDVPNRIVSWDRYEALLVVLGDLKLATPDILGGLAALQRRVGKRDSYLVDCIGATLAELKA